ncbi:MAG: hypothetical protein KF878_33165 [Planctomycetes bacterium]|nr:hypothetical protein [Planctomycetota bacterium]
MSWTTRAVLLLLLPACTAPTSPSVEPPPASARDGALEGPFVSVDVEDRDLADVMEQIGRQAGRVIHVDPAVRERVTVGIPQLPWRDMVDVIARMTRCDVEERSDGTLLLSQPPTVRVTWTDTNARTLLQLLAAHGGRNVLLPPSLGGPPGVSAPYEPPSWRAGFDEVLATCGDYDAFDPDPETIRVLPRVLTGRVVDLDSDGVTLALDAEHGGEGLRLSVPPPSAAGALGALRRRLAAAGEAPVRLRWAVARGRLEVTDVLSP